jgi:hypothetical protein
MITDDSYRITKYFPFDYPATDSRNRYVPRKVCPKERNTYLFSATMTSKVGCLGIYPSQYTHRISIYLCISTTPAATRTLLTSKVPPCLAWPCPDPRPFASEPLSYQVAKLQRAALQNPIKVEVSHKYQTVSTLVQQYAFFPYKYKDCYLTYTMNEFNGNSAIVFTATCSTAQRLALLLRNLA